MHFGSCNAISVTMGERLEIKEGRPFSPMRPHSPGAPIEWVVSARPIDYGEAVTAMEARVAAILAGTAPELVWLLEHPSLYTAGTSANPADLLQPERLPIFASGRGGQYTYHGPGQRIAYVLLDLTRRRQDIRCFVDMLEEWIIASLARIEILGERRAGRVGVWIARPDRGEGAEDKIAAIGVRLRRWVTYHGVALNIAPDLSHYAGIVPCGMKEHGATSLADLGRNVSLSEVDAILRQEFEPLFGETSAAS